MAKVNTYSQLIEKIFLAHFRPGLEDFVFERLEIERAASELRVRVPKNLGDLVYNFRYRRDFPESVKASAPRGKEWVILPAGRGRCRFVATALANILPNLRLTYTKVPDATPGLVEMYALTDEQALLAKLRYNRLIDVFTSLSCYSLQSHLRTTIPDIGQVETDERYVGIDRRGAHYILPVQAKGGRDRLSVVQVAQDFSLCAARFPSLLARPLAAQFIERNLIALFEFEQNASGVAVAAERHYQLVPPDQLTEEDIRAYSQRLADQ